MKLNQLKESTHGLYATEISQGDQLKLSKFKIYLFWMLLLLYVIGNSVLTMI